MTGVVYQHFDENGEVLYVGVTHNHKYRTYQHKARSPWWPSVKKVKIMRFKSRDVADLYEAYLIAVKKPPNNKAFRLGLVSEVFRPRVQVVMNPSAASPPDESTKNFRRNLRKAAGRKMERETGINLLSIFQYARGVYGLKPHTVEVLRAYLDGR